MQPDRVDRRRQDNAHHMHAAADQNPLAPRQTGFSGSGNSTAERQEEARRDGAAGIGRGAPKPIIAHTVAATVMCLETPSILVSRRRISGDFAQQIDSTVGKLPFPSVNQL